MRKKRVKPVRNVTLTPMEMATTLKDILAKYADDPEKAHIALDQALVSQLRALGYVQAMNVFQNARKFYS